MDGLSVLLCCVLLASVFIVGYGVPMSVAQEAKDQLAKKQKELQGSAVLPEDARVLCELALSYLDSVEDALADYRPWRAMKQANRGLAAIAKAQHRLDCSPASAGNGLQSGAAAEVQPEAGSDPTPQKQPTVDCVARVA